MQNVSKYLLLLSFTIISLTSLAQTKNEIERSKKLYEGTWFNKKDNRYIKLSFEKNEDFATVNDWIKNEEENTDAYKAYIKDDKLILYADSTEHRAPYCELKIHDKILYYECNFNYKDNFLNKNAETNTLVFIRKRK